MVGAYLKPLADKLWDNDKSKDIEILNWMQEIDMGKQWVDRQREKTRKDSNNARRKTYILAESIAINRLSNQWKVTK